MIAVDFPKLSLNWSFYCYNSLDNDVINTRPQELEVDSYFFKMSAESAQWPLIANVVLICSLIVNELRILLVHRVVSEMYKAIGLEVLLTHILLVLLGSKASESFIEYINSKRVHWGNKDVNSEIEFKSVD